MAAQETWKNVDNDPVTLSNQKARLYAFSPSIPVAGPFVYNGDATLDPTRVPINFNTPNKVDYLYGTHRNTKDGVTDPDGDNTTEEVYTKTEQICSMWIIRTRWFVCI